MLDLVPEKQKSRQIPYGTWRQVEGGAVSSASFSCVGFRGVGGIHCRRLGEVLLGCVNRCLDRRGLVESNQRAPARIRLRKRCNRREANRGGFFRPKRGPTGTTRSSHHRRRCALGCEGCCCHQSIFSCRAGLFAARADSRGHSAGVDSITLLTVESIEFRGFLKKSLRAAYPIGCSECRTACPKHGRGSSRCTPRRAHLRERCGYR